MHLLYFEITACCASLLPRCYSASATCYDNGLSKALMFWEAGNCEVPSKSFSLWSIQRRCDVRGGQAELWRRHFQELFFFFPSILY